LTGVVKKNLPKLDHSSRNPDADSLIVSRNRPASSHKYEPASYKSNPYKTKAQILEEQTRRSESSFVQNGKVDYVMKNKIDIKKIQEKKQLELERRKLASELDQEVEASLQSSNEQD